MLITPPAVPASSASSPAVDTSRLAMALKLKFWPKVLVTGSVESKPSTLYLLLKYRPPRTSGLPLPVTSVTPAARAVAPWKSRVASGSEFRKSMSKLSPTVLERVLISGAFWMMVICSSWPVSTSITSETSVCDWPTRTPSWTTLRSLGAEALILNTPGNSPWKRNAPSSLVVVLLVPPI